MGPHLRGYRAIVKDADGVVLAEEDGAAVVEAGLALDVLVAEEERHLGDDVGLVVEAECVRHDRVARLRKRCVPRAGRPESVRLDRVRNVSAGTWGAIVTHDTHAWCSVRAGTVVLMLRGPAF